MASPVLHAADARIDDGGVPVVDGLTLATTGQRVLVLGAAQALFEAFAGMRDVARGRVLLGDEAPRSAVQARRAACAPMDRGAPAKMTAQAYVAWSARLAGMGRGEAERRAKDAIARLGLTPFALSPIDKATLPVQRGCAVAAALATGAPLLVLEDPCAGLPEDLARPLAQTVAQALQGEAFALFAGRASLVSPLVRQCDEALVLFGSAVVAQGAPAEIAIAARVFALRVLGDAEAFAERAADVGARVSGRGSEITVTLPEGMKARALLALALEAGAVVVELRAASAAFA